MKPFKKLKSFELLLIHSFKKICIHKEALNICVILVFEKTVLVRSPKNDSFITDFITQSPNWKTIRT